MAIVFYEKEYCIEILENGVEKLRQRDLNYLAKYWDDLGLKEKEIEEMLIDFCLKNDENFNEIQNYQFIRRAVIHARNNQLRSPKPVRITKAEIQSIQEIEDYNIQKFLFIMLLVAKFFKYHQSRKNVTKSPYDHYLYSNTSIRELKKLANVKFTRKEWKEIKHELTIAGLINPTIISSNKWVLGFWNETSPTEILIEDYRNPVSYYKEYCGEDMIECVNCGVSISKRSNRHSYCRKCWKERNKELWRKNSKKYYEKVKFS